jgi:molybdopterin molybdotransferase
LSVLSVPEAVNRIVGGVQPMPVERVALLDSLGRVLAAPVVSRLTLPAWDNSAMDGYAVRGADVEGATAQHPRVLRVLETVAAGQFPSRAVAAGEAVRIMTGAPLPSGADSVVRVEDTDGGVEQVVVRNSRDAGRNRRPRGEDLRSGDVVLPAGTPIGPAQIGLLASIGAAVVDVHRRPRVAILGSGDELVDLDKFDEALAGRRIVSSNSYALLALCRSTGAEPVNLGVVADAP